MRVLPCQAVPGVEIHGYAPQFNAKNFSHVFHDKSTYTVPGMRNLIIIRRSSKVDPTNKREKEKKKGDGGMERNLFLCGFI